MINKTYKANLPIIEYKTLKEAYESLYEWQERLFLTDWIFKLELVAEQEGCDDVTLGTMTSYSVLNSAKISLLKLKAFENSGEDCFQKFCHEETLVHELLHCKYAFLTRDKTYESKLVDLFEHKQLEQMAKSLIMAKYNLKFDWFKNFEEEE